jgi:ribonucleoside-diphosphate reductase alpha chain
MTKLLPNAIRVLQSRYLLRNGKGVLTETPDQLFRRVARHMAQAELNYANKITAQAWEEKFFRVMSDLLFLPNSPTLMNAGLPLNQLSACFVLPVNDTLEDIFTTLKQAALIQQSGGGTGFNFSRLRHQGNFIQTTSGYSSGPLAFMKIFDAATENIKQGGKRRGANMGILNIDHPDIERFISIKQEEGVLRNFNLSVGITDAFMQCVLNDELWYLKDPNTGETVKKLKAKYLWDMLVENAWRSGDPGLVFLDTINAANPTPHIGSIMCTNPCGEVPLLPYEACNLGSVDLAKCFDEKSGTVDKIRLKCIVEIAVRFLDNVIDMNNYIIPEIKQMVKGNRKIGLGVMGWADLLIKMEIPYASCEAVSLGEELMAFLQQEADKYSEILANERGVFANWRGSIFAPAKRIRNATRTSIAPTGTISIIAGTSSSIEPNYALAIRRENILNNEELFEINPHVLSYLKKYQLDSPEVLDKLKTTGSIQDTDLPDAVKQLFLTALEIDPAWHLKHQVAFQKHTDNAVSKTINLPNSASVNEVAHAFLSAWRGKAKGITVYRDGCKQLQVLKSGLGEPDNKGSCRVCNT